MPEGWPWDVDLRRLREGRNTKIQAALEREGVAGFLLLTTGNVYYATGVQAVAADNGRTYQHRSVALVVKGDPTPHLFTPYPEAAPPDLDDEHLHLPVYLESEAGVIDLAARLTALLDGVPGPVAVDDLTAPMYAFLPRSLGRELPAADGAMVMLRLYKTPDELELMRRCWRLNEAASAAVERVVRPGIRMSDLSGVFLRHLFELGASCNFLDPVFQAMPARIEDGPWSTNGDVPFALVTNDHIARQGEAIWTDTVVGLEGYSSDVGRTWVVGKPSPTMRSLFARWNDITQAVIEVLKPGVTGADLTRVATESNGGTPPWLAHYFLAHGLGIEGGEYPQIGSDRGPAFDEQFVFEPGMAIVIEPVTWADGHSGYRCEELLFMTSDSCELVSAYPNEPFA